MFNTDLVKMKINVLNAEKIFSNAIEVLNSDIPDSSEACGFCAWIRENEAV